MIGPPPRRKKNSSLNVSADSNATSSEEGEGDVERCHLASCLKAFNINSESGHAARAENEDDVALQPPLQLPLLSPPAGHKENVGLPVFGSECLELGAKRVVLGSRCSG